MKKRSVTKLLSCVLAFSMVATTAIPVTALASEAPAAAEQELEVTDVTSRGVLEDGVNDAWSQDEATVKGEDAVNEKTEDGWLHLKAGSENGNTANNAASYPAVFVNPNTFDFTKEGYFEFTMKSVSAKSESRFGIYLGYKNPGDGMFLGYDNGGWFWQKYSDGTGDYFTGTRTAAPEAEAEVSVRISWTADKKFTLAVDGTEVFTNESCDLDLSSGKIGLKLGTFGTTQITETKLKDIHYTGQKELESHQVTGKIVDENGAGVEGASVSIEEQTVTTQNGGTYTFPEVAVGTHTITVTKDGYSTAYGNVTVESADVAAADITLLVKPSVATRTLSTANMDVQVAEKFPYIVQYNMKGNLAGKTFLGQTKEINTIKINGTAIQVGENDIKTTFTDTKATYEMTLKADNIDCVITAEITADKNTAAFDITKVENKLTDKDENGYEVYPVQTIEIPDHSLISVNSSQTNANLKAAKMSSNTTISGDKYFDVTSNLSLSEDFMYGFVSNDELSAGLWSNSENQGTNVAAYVSAGGASNTRVIAKTSREGSSTSLGLSSALWYYDRKITPTVNGEPRTYVVEHEIMPSAKVVITGDENGDGDIDWQDGAVAYRAIMNNPQGYKVVPELVNYRIAMNFGSQAANPFLTNLDGVKRVYLNTDGLGQGVLLKGYGSEGHDSGHPDYGDIGTRIGGAEDMNTLLTEGKKMGALFGVHVNASEMYTEAKAFNDELSRGNYGWNWLDQGIGINGLYDLASGSRESRFQELYDQVGNNLDFIYVDVWGNNTSGAEDAWESRMLAREINSFGWRLATEWGPTQEYDSTLQHWAADLAYGGAAAKGENSEVMRFLRNHQKDSWVADYPSYGGAAQAPLLGGLNMTDFEGWQGRTDYDNYITVMFRHNLITKYLQHYQIVDWVDGNEVTMGSTKWVPEMQITLKNTENDRDNTVIVVSRDSNDYSNLAQYRSRTITVDGVTVSTGAPTGGDGSNRGNEKYLIPWNWDSNGKALSSENQKLYHWNTIGGTSTWTLTKDWEGLENVVVYKLTDEGKTDKQVVPVTNNQITLTAEAETPYVIYKGEKEQLTVDWQTSKYIYDMGFNDPDVNSHRNISGTGTATIVDNASANNMLKLDGEVAVSTALTNLTPGQKYAVYIGTDNRSEARAYMKVLNGTEVLGSNYTTRSFVRNIVSSDQHHWGSGATTTDSTLSYFQNMYVFFTAPESGTATLVLSREEGTGSTYFDDVRVVETQMDVVRGTDEEGNITSLYNDFEHNAQGIWPFVISGPGTYIDDNRIHLSERHDKYTQAGYLVKEVDDVLDGDWSVKINGLTQKNSMIYQTIPQNFHFVPGETYYVSFDYQMGGDGTYEVRVGDGTDINVDSYSMEAAIGETKTFSFSFTASESGNSWIGIYSTGEAADLHGLSEGARDFSGYKDFILDNLKIQKTAMRIDKTSVTAETAKDKIPLHISFTDAVVDEPEVIWTSSDEKVAKVNSNGEVYFVGFGTATITATAVIDGEETSLNCVVKLPSESVNTATFENVWCNTQETSGEDGAAVNVTDRSSGTIWHSQWSSDRFTVSESNPAVITMKIAEDISEFTNRALVQRSGNNGLVQKYEIVVGDTFDTATQTITNPTYSSGTVTATHSASGSTEILSIPADTKGHYIQIRVLQGSGNYASIADILLDSTVSYDTEEERGYMAANAAQVEKDEIDFAKSALANAVTAADEIYAKGQADYTAESWKAFADAYAAAKEAQADDTKTVSELKTLKKALAEAQAALKKEGSTDEPSQDELAAAKKSLSDALAAADAIYAAGGSAYTAESWKAFADAYTAAKNVAADADATSLKGLAEALTKAQAGLVKAAATTPNPTPNQEDTLKVGDTVTVKNVVYKVTSVSKKTVTAVKGKNKKITSAVIPATVKVKGVTCKVTAVSAKAFKGYAKLKKVTIGKNVATIGKQAFYGCKKLTKVTFKGKALKAVKSGAFKKTNAKLKVTLPKSLKGKKRTKVVKLLKKAGVKTTIK